jgi:CheY-like chemotaxis protein
VPEEFVVYTVVVCDTEPVAIEGVRSVLESSGAGFIRAAETSLPRALEAVRNLEPALFLVDKAFGIFAVMDCLKALRNCNSHTATVVWGVSVPEG